MSDRQEARSAANWQYDPILGWHQHTESAAQDTEHWLAVEFELRRVLDDDEAVDAALALKEAGFTVTAPEHLRSAALVREGQADA